MSNEITKKKGLIGTVYIQIINLHRGVWGVSATQTLLAGSVKIIEEYRNSKLSGQVFAKEKEIPSTTFLISKLVYVVEND